MKIERQAIFLELNRKGEPKPLPPQTICFEDGNINEAFKEIEAKRQSLIEQRGRKIAFHLLINEEGEIVYSNDDYDLDLS